MISEQIRSLLNGTVPICTSRFFSTALCLQGLRFPCRVTVCWLQLFTEPQPRQRRHFVLAEPEAAWGSPTAGLPVFLFVRLVGWFL